MKPAQVGILTFHDTINYGATLQSVALAAAVRKLGHEPKIIDYVTLKLRLAKLKYTFLSTEAFSRLSRIRRFNRFSRSRAARTRSFLSLAALSKNPPPLDAAIVGSDQVWNIESYRGYDPVFFLDWIANKPIRRISYAASAGNIESFGQYQASIAASLKRFDALSVRDQTTHDLVLPLTGQPPTIVVDPVFLIMDDFRSEWNPTAQDYVFSYTIGNSDLSAGVLQNLKKAAGLPAVGARVYSRLPGVDIDVFCAGPEEWLERLSGAKYVLTNSFHGICFAVMMRKPLVVPMADDGSGLKRRVDHLLTSLNLTDVVVGSPTEAADLAVDRRSIDWDDVEGRLRAMCDQSWEFLRSSLA